jgi:transposase
MAKADKKKMMIDEFLPLYLKAVAEGMTKEEFAEMIDVKPATIYQRVYELRRDVDPSIPLLQPKRRKTMAERARAILELHRSGADEDEPQPKAKVKKEEAKTEPATDETDAELSEIFG